MATYCGILNSWIPGIQRKVYFCPAPRKGLCSESNYWQGVGVKGLIVHLNDYHKWTFDQIADYLETLSIDLTVKES